MKLIVSDPCTVFDEEPDCWPGSLEVDGLEEDDKIWAIEVLTLDQLHDILLMKPGNYVTADIHLFAPLRKKQVLELYNLSEG